MKNLLLSNMYISFLGRLITSSFIVSPNSQPPRTLTKFMHCNYLVFFVLYLKNVSSTWTNQIMLVQLCIIAIFVPKLEVDYILLLRIFMAKGSRVIKTLIQGPTKCTI